MEHLRWLLLSHTSCVVNPRSTERLHTLHTLIRTHRLSYSKKNLTLRTNLILPYAHSWFSGLHSNKWKPQNTAWSLIRTIPFSQKNRKISEIFYQRCIKDPVQHLLCSFCAIIVSQNFSQKCSIIIVYKRSKYAFVHGRSKEFIEFW